MRDWKKTLRRASYRGVAFWVDYDDKSGGKRLAKHEYAGGKAPVIEELGLMTTNFDVTLYIAGETADLEAPGLEAVMLADGPGLLTLPIDGSFLATAEGFRRSRSKDRFNYIGFDVTFIPAAAEAGAVLSIGDVTSVVANLASAAIQFARLF